MLSKADRWAIRSNAEHHSVLVSLIKTVERFELTDRRWEPVLRTPQNLEAQQLKTVANEFQKSFEIRATVFSRDEIATTFVFVSNFDRITQCQQRYVSLSWTFQLKQSKATYRITFYYCVHNMFQQTCVMSELLHTFYYF